MASAIVIYLGLGIYLYGLLATYMTNISEYEAIRTLSFDRFVSVYLAGMVPPAIALARLNGWDRRLTPFLIVILGVCLFLAPAESTRYLRHGAWPITNERRALIARVQPALAKIPRGAKVYIVWQDSNGFEYWQVRYELGYHHVNLSCWSIAPVKDGKDMYKCPMSPAQLQAGLKDFEYLLVAKGDDTLAESYPSLFNGDRFDGAVLYRVDACAAGGCLSKM